MRARAHVSGLVQGVGFRPFAWRAATALGLSGWVSNDAAGVVLEAEDPAADVASLLAALTSPPPLARVDAVRCAVNRSLRAVVRASRCGSVMPLGCTFYVVNTVNVTITPR